MWTRARRLAAGWRSTTGRSNTERSNLRRERRGATLVFVAVFALALVGVAAFAIDASRLYVGTNELQTGADAAALRAARYMQSNPGSDPTSVAQAFSPSNESLGSGVQLAAQDVSPVLYDPDDNTFTPATWATANAVEVRATRVGNLLFGRLLTGVMPSPSRRSVAWVANVTQVNCPTPWGFPVLALNDRLNPGSTNSSSISANTFASVDSALGTATGARDLTMIFWPPTHLNNGGPQIPKQTGSDSAFYALADNMSEYPSQIANPESCAANSSIAIGPEEPFSGIGGGSVESKTVNGVEGTPPAKLGMLCQTPQQPANSADCWPPGTSNFSGQTPGVRVIVAWVGSENASTVPVVAIGGFRVMCVYRGTKGGGPKASVAGASTEFFLASNSHLQPGDKDDKPKPPKDPPGPPPAGNESCQWLDGPNKSYFDARGVSTPYDEGTIVGYPEAIYPGLGPGTKLGAEYSLGQRLILVR